MLLFADCLVHTHFRTLTITPLQHFHMIISALEKVWANSCCYVCVTYLQMLTYEGPGVHEQWAAISV